MALVHLITISVLFSITFGYVFLRKCCLKSGTKAANLASLPPELLISIFSHLPLKDLLCHISPACSKFALLTKYICDKRRTLALVYGDESLLVQPLFHDLCDANDFPENTPFLVPKSISACNTLHFHSIRKSLTEKNALKIVSLFPNIRSLQLTTDGLTAALLTQVVNLELLQKWISNLESLQLILHFELMHPIELITQEEPLFLCEAFQQTVSIINRASKLRRLALYVRAKLEVQLDLPIISQLYEFYFYSIDYTDKVISNSLKSYALTNDKLTHIGLVTKAYRGQWCVKTILSNQPTDRMFANKLTYLKISDSPVFPLDDNDDFRFENFFVGLPNLVVLSINWYVQRPLIRLLRALEQITTEESSKLSFLVLNIISGRDTVPQDPPTDPSLADLSSLISNGKSICQLRSIKSFDIYCLSTSHQSILRLHLNLIFPNLSTLYISTKCIRCACCEYTEEDYLAENVNYLAKVYPCIRLMVEPLKLMPSKPKITFKYKSNNRGAYNKIKF